MSVPPDAHASDVITGLKDDGLIARQETEGNPLGGDFKVHVFVGSQPVACYRDEALLGIWDPETRQLRAAAQGEAPATYSPPEPME